MRGSRVATTNTYVNLLLPRDRPEVSERPRQQSGISSLKGLVEGAAERSHFPKPCDCLLGDTRKNHVSSAQGDLSSPLPLHTSNQRISSCALFTVDIFWLIGEE